MANLTGLVVLFVVALVAVLVIVWAVLRGNQDRMANDTIQDDPDDSDDAGGKADSDLVNIDGLDQISRDDLTGAQDRLQDQHSDDLDETDDK